MDKKIITFGDTEIENQKFHYHKNPIQLYDADINKTIVCNKVSFGKKVLNILQVPKVSTYGTIFD